MSTISLRLPESIHQAARELARREGISINQLVSTALAEKISALMTSDYLEERAKRASREKFDTAFSKTRDVAPNQEDRLDR